MIFHLHLTSLTSLTGLTGLTGILQLLYYSHLVVSIRPGEGRDGPIGKSRRGVGIIPSSLRPWWNIALSKIICLDGVVILAANGPVNVIEGREVIKGRHVEEVIADWAGSTSLPEKMRNEQTYCYSSNYPKCGRTFECPKILLQAAM